MPARETPPNSPSMSLDNPEDEVDPLDENDIVEILEVDDDVSGVDSDEGRVEEEEEEDVDKIPERDDAQLVFEEHKDGVLCCQFHPKFNNIVASGGMDDSAYIWNTQSGEKFFTCSGHEDSVEMVSFSHDGTYLATADLNGVIKVWRMRDYILINTFELEDELGWILWHPGTNVIVASSQTGMIYMYKVPSGDTKMVMASFGQNCLTGKILSDGKSLVCGFKDGIIKIVDLKLGTILQDIKPFDEIGGVSCLDAQKNNLIICGCVSGAVLLINANNGKVLSVLQNIQSSDGSNYIEAVSFCKDFSYQIAASGSLDGSIIIWDIIKQTLRHKHVFSSCVNHLSWHPSLPILFTCHFEGVVRAFDARAGTVLKEYLGHRKSCLNMSLSSDGSLLMTTSEDKTVRIFSVENIFCS